MNKQLILIGSAALLTLAALSGGLIFGWDPRLLAVFPLLILILMILMRLNDSRMMNSRNILLKQSFEETERLKEKLNGLDEEKLIADSRVSESVVHDGMLETVCRVEKEIRFYRKALHHLLMSITTHLSTTTSPIAADLLAVQQEIKNFLTRISSYDEEISEKSSLKQILKKNEEIKSGTEIVSRAITETFFSFNKNLEIFEKILAKIFDTSREIEDIADKVNVLSINAAIEAARSGNEGKGFRVISEEIKKLSGHTFNFLKEIKATLNESRSVISGINQDFKTREDRILEQVKIQEKNSVASYDIFTRYYQNFEDIYNQIQIFIEMIRLKVTNISPIVQLHEITIQEAENLDLTVTDFMDEAGSKLSRILESVCPQTEIPVHEMVERIRRRLTTSRELDALEKTVKEFNPSDPVDLKRQNKSIELF
jgi:methyl-accepting chemotaxis protein